MKPFTRIATVALLPCLLGIAGCLPGPPVKTTLVIVGGQYIEAEDAEPVRDVVILIEGDTIASAGPQSLVRFPKGVEKLDARDKWIVPGLVNGGVLTIFPTPTQPDGPRKANLLVFHGNPLSPDYDGEPPDFVIEDGRLTMKSAPGLRQP